MRRTVFLILIAVTLLITAFFCWREFILPEIDFVDDNVETDVVNQIIVKRLYASSVDPDAYAEALQSIQNMTEEEFDEDQVLYAAKKSGTPEFYPAFILSVIEDGEDIILQGFTDVKLAEGQKDLKFKLGNVNMEAVVKSVLTINEFNITPFEDVKTAPASKEIIPKINSDAAVAADLSKAAGFEIKMAKIGENETGSITLQYVYAIDTNTFMPRTVLEEQLLQIHIDISRDADGKVKAEFTPEPYSNLEDLEG